MGKSPLISGSLLSGDFAAMGKTVKTLEEADIDLFHVDVMDGHFVPNITMGPAMVAALRPLTSLHLDVHLMMTNPSILLDSFLKAGSDALTIHVEIEEDIPALLRQIRASSRKAGLALNPMTKPEALVPYMDLIDQVLVMTVHPGFSGGSFQASALHNIANLATYRRHKDLSFTIVVDGGVTPETAPAITIHGADILVSGSYLVGGNPNTYKQRLETLRQAANSPTK